MFKLESTGFCLCASLVKKTYMSLKSHCKQTIFAERFQVFSVKSDSQRTINLHQLSYTVFFYREYVASLLVDEIVEIPPLIRCSQPDLMELSR